jgi:hypothetical protein
MNYLILQRKNLTQFFITFNFGGQLKEILTANFVLVGILQCASLKSNDICKTIVFWHNTRVVYLVCFIVVYMSNNIKYNILIRAICNGYSYCVLN